MKNSEWIFFDVGSTLIDEKAAYEHRIRDAISGTDITYEEFCEKRIYFAKQNLKGDLAAIDHFKLKKTPWHKEDEVPYPDTEPLLRYLSEKGYKLGLIANQSAGTAARFENWGLKKYISVISASAEVGASKPDKRIFMNAFRKSGCTPENSVMIGDRLDNDIYPAKALGMKTIWVRQDMAVYQTPPNAEYEADITVGSLSELFGIF